ncbi:MAG: hypothetical protein ACREIT_03125 [Tepidisphaeraceae bacterium]
MVVIAALAAAAVALLAGAGVPTSRPATGAAVADPLDRFEFRGQPIHPACVMQLGTELSDGLPIIAAVDVEGCTESDQHPAAIAVRDEWVRIDLKDGGRFTYRHLGVSSGGTHVLHTQSSGGGTGIFEDLLLVRFQQDRVRQQTKWRDRLLMTSVGSFILGDRDDGEIRFEQTQVRVGRSRYREQDTVIPLDEER